MIFVCYKLGTAFSFDVIESNELTSKNYVWGFVAKKGGVHKGLPMKVGDVFKAASWNAAAKHTRGNIFDNNQDYFEWTGPNYR